jgi:hypothetical protein
MSHSVQAVPSDDRTIRAMTGTLGTHGDPCKAYHQAYMWHQRSRRPEARARWLRILTKLKAQFPPGGCEHVVTG